jgi:hypothetical protein
MGAQQSWFEYRRKNQDRSRQSMRRHQTNRPSLWCCWCLADLGKVSACMVEMKNGLTRLGARLPPIDLIEPLGREKSQVPSVGYPPAYSRHFIRRDSLPGSCCREQMNGGDPERQRQASGCCP